MSLKSYFMFSPLWKRGPGGFYNASLFLIALTLLSCSGAPGGGVGILIPGPTDEGGGGGQVSSPFDSNASPTDTGNDEGGSIPDDDALPQASIPSPTLIKPNPSKMLTASADSNNYIPVIGFEGSGIPGSQIVVSNNPAVAKGHGEPRRTMYSRLLARIHSLINPAYAQLAPDTTCPFENATCCPVQADGSFACYHPGDNNTELYIYTTDGTNLSDPVNDRPNKNVLWLSEAPKDLSGDPTSNNILSLTQDIGVSIEDTGDEFRVSGNFEQNYQDSSIQGTTGAVELASKPDTDQLALRVPNAMVQTFNSIVADVRDPAGAMVNRTMVMANEVRIDTDTLEYTVLKRSGDNKLRYGRETITATNKEWIFNAADTTTPSEKIKFLDSTDSINFKKTVAFDVDGTYALVAFLDDAGKTRLRMGTNDSVPVTLKRFGGSTPLPGAYDIKDIQIFHNSTPAYPGVPPAPGHAFILDTLNNRIGIIDFNYRVSPPAVLNISWPANLEMGASKDPESLIINFTKTKAYVMNKGDNTLSVIDLTNPTAVPGSIDLKTYLHGKELNIKPNEVAFNATGDHLIIGAEDIKSALVIPVNP